MQGIIAELKQNDNSANDKIITLIAKLEQLSNESERLVEDSIRFDRPRFGKQASNIKEAKSSILVSPKSFTVPKFIANNKPNKTSTSIPLKIEEFEPVVIGPHSTQFTVATVLDPFSHSAFSYEWNGISLHPKTWETQMESSKPDLLFVESAWEGNDGAWKYMFTGKRAPWPEVIDLLQWCKSNGVPSVFWNKEDPPHYQDFLKTAELFDVVFTSDVNCVPKYKLALGHDRVYVLPFAAQPRVHNPARPESIRRTGEVAFGGMYFRHKYPERRHQMDYLLPAAQRFELDIYSRQLGGDLNYQFPDQYTKNVVGSLNYKQMLSAYHGYKIFLNVNSVTDSESMCARRIFEITACGASVVSPPSPAIKTFFPNDTVAIVENEEQSYNVIRGLLRSEAYRTRQLHLAQRQIWENHTYSHRANHIFEMAGLNPNIKSQKISVLAPTIRPHLIPSILEMVSNQQCVDVQLVLNMHGFDIDRAKVRSQALAAGISDIVIMSLPRSMSLGECLNRMVESADGDILTKFDDDDYYGPNYLRDLVNALCFSGAEVVGKAATYAYFESKDATVLTYANHEHRYTEFIRGATLTAKKEVFVANKFPKIGLSEDSAFLKSVVRNGGRIYSADRFNYTIMRSANTSDHTWQEDDSKLFATGDVSVFGSPYAHVTV